MTAKEYLRQLHTLEVKYQAKMEQANDMRLLAESTGAIRYDKDRVQTSPQGDSLTNAVIRIMEAETDAAAIANQYLNTKTQIIEQIINMEDDKYMRCLCLRYVHNIPLNDIADKMHFTYQYMKEVHGKALQAFEETYPYIKKL